MANDECVFTCEHNGFEVTPQVKECYNQHGYIIVRLGNLFYNHMIIHHGQIIVEL